MAITFVFDGITVDHARELLTDDPLVAEIGHRCSYQYLTSLADLAVGLVSCTKVSTTNMTPGQWIGKTFDNKFDPIEVRSPLQPKDMLQVRSRYRKEIADHIHLLSRLHDSQYVSWQQHMIREVRAFLGDHASIYEDLPDPAKYTFYKEFTYDKELQALIPTTYITKMHDALYPEEGTPSYLEKVRGKAIREFITRNVVAHIVVFCWYRNITAKKFIMSKCLRWPHITRATLIEAGSDVPWAKAEKAKESPEAVSLWMVREVLMPNILTPILVAARGEPDPVKVVRYRLQELVSGSQYEEERDRIEEIIGLLANLNDGSARAKIDGLIADLSEKGSPKRTKFSVSFPGSIKIEWEESTRGVGHIFRQGGLRWQDYEQAAREVFPNLFRKPNR